MSTQVVRTSDLTADEVTRRLAATLTSPAPARGLDRFTGGFDVGEPIVFVQGGVSAEGHVHVWVRQRMGGQNSLRPVLSGRVVDVAGGGSRFDGTLAPADWTVPFEVLWLSFASLVLVTGLAAEVWALVTGRSATHFLPIPVAGTVFVAFGSAFWIVAARSGERQDGPVLLDWLDGAMRR